MTRARNSNRILTAAAFVLAFVASAAVYKTASAATVDQANVLVTEGAAVIHKADTSFTAAALLPAYLHAARATSASAIVTGTALALPGDSLEHGQFTATEAKPRIAIPAAAPKIKISWGGSYKQGSFSGGQCTWYVSGRRGGLKFRGNAWEWPANARAAGLKTGKTPVAGAILITTEGPGHATFVEKVNSDGSFVISEMNYAGPYVKTTRTLKPNAPQIVTFIY
ncbi:MAG: CHAP domain-containing protein [Candidatus Andersenbacteria bacterium]